jgi:hypothetical protein
VYRSMTSWQSVAGHNLVMKAFNDMKYSRDDSDITLIPPKEFVTGVRIYYISFSALVRRYRSESSF